MSKWDERFDTEEYVYGEAPNVFIKQQSHLFKQNMKVLAIAEGEGRNAVWLAERGYDVEMWDYSQVGLEKALRLANQRKVTIKTRLIDLSDAEWPISSFDAIICVFGHFPQDVKSKVFEGVQQSLRPGGVFITEVYSEKQIQLNTGGPKHLNYLYTITDFKTLNESLETLYIFDGIVEREEGKLHKGKSAVIQYIGQKHDHS